jgi:hypothetical protein
MSEGYAKIKKSMKGNKMEKVKSETLGTRDLVEFVKIKTGLTDIGAYSYALTLTWAMSSKKLKQEIIQMIEENN